MRGTLTISINAVEGALIRVLGLVVRRGYSLIRVNATGSEIPDLMDVVLTVEGTRPIDRLARQLERLLEVRGVELAVAPRLRLARRAAP